MWPWAVEILISILAFDVFVVSIARYAVLLKQGKFYPISIGCDYRTIECAGLGFLVTLKPCTTSCALVIWYGGIPRINHALKLEILKRESRISLL